MFSSSGNSYVKPGTQYGIPISKNNNNKNESNRYSMTSNGSYNSMSRPPAAAFSSNYIREQGSHQSLQDHLQREAPMPMGSPVNSGFADVPNLNYPSTPVANNPSFSPSSQNPNYLNTPPPASNFSNTSNNNAPSIYSHGNNSQSNLRNNVYPNLHVSPGQYSVTSDYPPDTHTLQSPQHPQQFHGAQSPQHPQQYHSNSNLLQQSPVRSLKGVGQPFTNLDAAARQTNTYNPNPATIAPVSNYMYFERRPDLLSKSIQDKAATVKLKIENFYQSSVNYAIERNQRRVELESQLVSQDWSDERKSRQLSTLGKKESQFLRLRRTRLSLEDFQTVKVIGKGAFGEVRLVQKRDTGKIYAMKTLLKSEMYKKDQLAHVKAERDVLAGSDSPWVVSLYYSFQDAQYLYLIMEFLPGGDLMTMLIRWQIFTEDVTRFYMAECILAIEAIHKLGYIHRDIKPDNILIDIRGHIKLSDFGLSTGFHKTHDSNYYKKLLQQDEVNAAAGNLQKPQMGIAANNSGKNRNTMFVDAIHLTMTNRQQIQTWRKSRRLMAYSTVGTPDYIAPEIFLYQGYGQECDWWSLGAIMYECLIGWPPFCSETPQETYRKIMNFEQTLQFPDDIHISYEAEDLIRRLLTHADQRLGRHGGADEIKSHPFFRGVDWNSIRQVEAPYIPKLSSITDTRFFPTDDLENVPDSPAMAQAARQREQMNKQGGAAANASSKEDLPFIGYTYSRFDYLTRKNAL
ncbi:LANO_0H03224g1_1 [Lachancea nothofagi CBS 11611]|uniref:Serine/threonine-protein kinase CBK1 n=1 Tax=Lachancea nothofagi CBS 11611 TaxID=1266666 RepID=A0A1G4KL01_9SACH|nr:LANO_0H03224g1_1 [Lachancea nothofagi CBS 11611]